MVDMFKQICNYCKNSNCSNTFVIDYSHNVTTFRCLEYIKDETKIKSYEEPLVVTAKRDYVHYAEK